MAHESKPNTDLTGADHKRLGIKLFNFTWTLMKKKERTAEEIDLMIHSAHASRYHWEQFPEHTAKEVSIGEWQLSRVYALLARPEASLWHANRCLTACEMAGLSGWLLAFAHEAMARAYAVAQNQVGFYEHYKMAESLIDTIDDVEDRALLVSDLRLGPWYGFVEDEHSSDVRSDD